MIEQCRICLITQTNINSTTTIHASLRTGYILVLLNVNKLKEKQRKSASFYKKVYIKKTRTLHSLGPRYNLMRKVTWH